MLAARALERPLSPTFRPAFVALTNQVDASDLTTWSTVVDISSLGLVVTYEEVRRGALE